MKTPADGWDPEEREALRELEPELEALRRRHAADPPVDLLRAARAGVLPEDLQRDAEQHLADDEWARALTDDLAATDTAFTKEDEERLLRRIRTAGREQRRPSIWHWLLHPSFALATLVFIAATVSAMWYVNRSEPVQSIQPAEREEAAAAPGVPAFALALEKPPVKLSVAALTWRGTGGEKSLAEQLRPGLDAFRADDHATADRELARAAAAFPNAVEPVYYQGVSRLFLNDANGAVDSLSAAARRADASLRADVTWYLAVAEERAGRIADARAHVISLCESRSERSADACAALQRLK